MSNLIVKPESIAKIADFIAFADYNTWSFSLPVAVHNAFRDCKKNGFFQLDQLCKVLATENYKAVDCRYNHPESDELKPGDLESYIDDCFRLVADSFTPTPVWSEGHRIITADHIQLYKTLQCYLYQIDSDTTYQDDIYKALSELESKMSKWIVANMIEYKNANWE